MKKKKNSFCKAASTLAVWTFLYSMVLCRAFFGSGLVNFECHMAFVRKQLLNNGNSLAINSAYIQSFVDYSIYYGISSFGSGLFER